MSDAKTGAVVSSIDENWNQISRENEFIACFRAGAGAAVRLPTSGRRTKELQGDPESRQWHQHRGQQQQQQ